MVEWNDDNRNWAKVDGYPETTEVIDEFNELSKTATVDELIDWLLSFPNGWAGARWEAFPVSKFGEILKTIRESQSFDNFEQEGFCLNPLDVGMSVASIN